MKKSTTVATEFGDIQVRKLALKDYADIFKALKTLPGALGEVFNNSSDEEISNTAYLLQVLPEVIGDSIPEFAKVLSIPTSATAEQIEDMDISDILDLVDGFLEVNDWNRIVQTIKKIRARATKKSDSPVLPAQPQAPLATNPTQ